ncbi:O-antigen ligase family protein [Bacillus paranthracis]
MVTKLKQTDNYFPHFLLLFIVFQPILDLLTSFSIYVLHMSATVGIVVRFAFMLLALGYLLLHHKTTRREKVHSLFMFTRNCTGNRSCK